MLIYLRYPLFVSSLLFMSLTHASPWILPEDRTLQNSVRLLANAGYLSLPVDAYPLMWQPLAEELTAMDTSLMSDAELQAYLLLQNAAEYARQTRSSRLSLSASNKELKVQGNQPYAEKASIALSTELKGEQWALGIAKRWRHQIVQSGPAGPSGFSENSGHDWDGSYLALSAGNWVFSASQQQQWWGPARAQSFHGDLTARPARTLKVSRLNSRLPLLEALSWVGPVDVQLHYGEYLTATAAENVRFQAARLALRPLTSFELALSSRQLQALDSPNMVPVTAAWLIAEDSWHHTLDWRYSLDPMFSVYGELNQQSATEDSSGWQAGADAQISVAAGLLTLFAEYQHLSSGYQYWQNSAFQQAALPLAAQWSLGAQYHQGDGRGGYLQLNRQQFQPASGVLPANQISIGYQQLLFGTLIQLEYQLRRQKLADQTKSSDHAAGVRWQWRF